MAEQSPTPLDLRSHDLAADKREELLRLFPEIRTEGGRVDFERLKLALGEMVDTGRERYGLTWPGKADCFRAIQTPSMGTLRPAPEESVNFDTTGNLIIEGDNLEVLKLLQKSYLGRVKMIYIDPPYNTGNDFIYPDNFSESLETYLQYTGQVDAEGKKFSTNTDTDGRFHSRWLNMMYPRLYLARNLLLEDGVLFASIDGNELPNLIRLLDELFGEENRVGLITWKNVTDNNPTRITADNEFIVCYGRSAQALPQAWRSRFSIARDTLQEEADRLVAEGYSLPIVQERLREFIADNEESLGSLTRYKFVDAEGVYTGSESVHNPRPGGYDFEVLHPETGQPMRKPANGYRFPEQTFREMEAKGIILYGPDEKRIVKIKKYLRDYEDALRSVLVLDGRLGAYELRRLFPEDPKVFTNPKPSELISSLASFATEQEAVVLDFFAGSGSTAHAILDLNKQDGGNRKFILVQLPEPTDREDYPTIAEITKERVRRVIQKLNAEDEGQLDLATGPKPDRGFRVFKLAESNFTTWDAQVASPEELTGQLSAHVDHLRPGRRDQDLLAEIILKAGLPLTASVETLDAAGVPVHRVDGTLLVCLSRAPTLEAVRAMAGLAPERVVCLDAGFQDNDQLKANAVQLFKAKNIVFRTA